MVKLCENSEPAFEQVRRARFVRRRPYETQRVAPNVALLLIRARYFDPMTGEFTSRDPLEYVDGASLYRGYFVPGRVDPLGLLRQEGESPFAGIPLPTAEACEPDLFDEKCKINLFFGHCTFGEGGRFTTWFRGANREKEGFAFSGNGTYYMGAVTCFSSDLYVNPSERVGSTFGESEFIPVVNRIPGFPTTDDILSIDKAAYDMALVALDAAVNWAYQLCENRNHYKNGPDADQYMDKPHDCGSVTISASFEEDFENLVNLGQDNTGFQVIDNLPKRKMHHFKLEIDCDDLPEKVLPSTTYGYGN